MSNNQESGRDKSSNEVDPEGSEETHSEGDRSDRMKQKRVHLHPRDIREVQRILRSQPLYRSFSHVLRVYLTRSLLPRIEKGDVSPRKLVRQVTMRHQGPSAREGKQINLEDWAPVTKAAQTINEDLRRLEEQIAWRGSIRAFPFCKIRPTLIVRAAAREIAVVNLDGPAEFFSREGDEEASWKLPETIVFGGAFGGVSNDKEPTGVGPTGGETTGEGQSGGFSGPEAAGNKPGNQLLEKPPGQDRGGEQVTLAITDDAASTLKRKAEKENLYASDLARFAVWRIVQRIEEDPVKAFKYVQKDSVFYEIARDENYSGYQFYIDPDMKRRVSRARKALEKGPGKDLDRRLTQREVMQAAARFAIETEGLCPPVPGEEASQ